METSHTHTHAHTQAHTHARTRVCACVRVSLRVCVCVGKVFHGLILDECFVNYGVRTQFASKESEVDSS